MPSEAGDWHSPQVNRDRVWQAYVSSFKSHALGILQEDIQNSVDAYASDVAPDKYKILVEYDADKRILTHRDFGTRGMPHCTECEWGIKKSGVVCTNSDCPWGCYHNMGYTSKDVKDGQSIGSRGMGKSLQLLAGIETQVRTLLPDGIFGSSVWEKTTDWRWRFDKEGEKIDQVGTLIQTKGVIDSVHAIFINPDLVTAKIQERWFRLVNNGADVRYKISSGGKQKESKVSLLKWPEIDTSLGVDKAKLYIPSLIITYGGTRLGEIRNLTIFVARKPFPDEQGRPWGIAIVKNGKQTITRYNDFPGDIPENLRLKVFGFCDAICTEEEPFLKEAESATHEDYQWTHLAYKAVRRELNEIVRNLLQPFIRSGGEKVSEKEVLDAKQIRDLFNEALQEVPELALFGKEDVGGGEVEPEEKNHVYISRLEFEERVYKRGESVNIHAVIKNPLKNDEVVNLSFEHFDPTPVVVDYGEANAFIPKAVENGPGTENVPWVFRLDRSLAPGIHWVQVTLKDDRGNPIANGDRKPIRIRRSIYCELEPKKIKRGPRSGTGPDKDPGEKEDGKEGGEGTFGVAHILPFNNPESKDTLEASIDMSQATAFFNLSGRRLVYHRQTSKTKQAQWPVICGLIAEVLVKQKAELVASERETWEAKEFKAKLTELEELRAKFIRTVIKLLETRDDHAPDKSSSKTGSS